MQISTTRDRNEQRSVSHQHARMRGEGGQALVELALSMPLLLVILLGAAEFARMEYAGIEVADAAMAGVQYGAQEPNTAADTTGIQAAARGDAPDITLGTTTASISCICSDGSASTCLSTDCSTSAIEQILTVKTQATLTPVIHVPGLPATFALHGQAVQKVLQ
ncbi:MAG TPA: TadE family protein [Terracidiphilus sp.]|nr:TadE family protein [Terracidiphilus sp.]